MTARELQRVMVLNVLGKPLKNFKAPADHDDHQIYILFIKGEYGRNGKHKNRMLAMLSSRKTGGTE
ncbi:hypothetical protein Lal_00020559 [Lupinus albus]|nr:hypothetical protein Lal_00020559 [Lupinus albus]